MDKTAEQARAETTPATDPHANAFAVASVREPAEPWMIAPLLRHLLALVPAPHQAEAQRVTDAVIVYALEERTRAFVAGRQYGLEAAELLYRQLYEGGIHDGVRALCEHHGWPVPAYMADRNTPAAH